MVNFKNSLTADEDRLRLSPELFMEKNVHILFLERDSERWATDKRQLPWLTWLSYESIHSDYGAIMATPTVMETVRALPATSPDTLKAVGGV